MEGLPVRYKNEIVGYADIETNNITFLDTDLAKEVQKEILEGNSIGISSRTRGEIVDGKAVEFEKIGLDIIDPNPSIGIGDPLGHKRFKNSQ